MKYACRSKLLRVSMRVQTAEFGVVSATYSMPTIWEQLLLRR
jgi:hypothetical protein